MRTARVYLFGSGSKRVGVILSLARRLHVRGYRRLANYFYRKLERGYGLSISPKAKLGRNLKLPHPNGVVIGEGVKVGDNVVIYQQVTLGGARIGDGKQGRYPQIGDNTVIFAGAKIIGDIRVGENSVIGANAVVTKDVPAFHTAVGIPAVSHRKDQG